MQTLAWPGTLSITLEHEGLPPLAGHAGKRVACPLPVSPLTRCIYYLPVVAVRLHLA